MHLPHWLTDHGSQIYQLFYVLPFYLVSFGMLLHALRHKWPIIPFLLITGMGRLGFLAGLWYGGNGGRSVLFALLTGAIVTYATIRWLRFRQPILDAYALFLPLGLALQRFGCLAVGCCWGNATDSWLGVHYPGTPAVHLWPLYMMLGQLGIFFTMLVLRRHLRVPGQLALVCLGAISLLRFSLEFLRDPDSNQRFATVIWGLKQLQWYSLATGLAFMAIAWWLGARASGKMALRAEAESYQDSARQWQLGALYVILLMGASSFLNYAEWITMIPTMLLLLVVAVGQLSKLHVPRWILATLFGAALVIADETRFDLLLGAAHGKVTYPTRSHLEDGGCGDDYTVYTDYRQKYYTQGELGLRMSFEDLSNYRTYIMLEGSLLSGAYYSPSEDNQAIRIKTAMHLGWFGLGAGAYQTNDPDRSLYKYSHGFGYLTIGNYRDLYFKGGFSEDLNGHPYFGFGLALLDEALRLETGKTDKGMFANFSYDWEEVGLGAEARTHLMLDPVVENDVRWEQSVRILRRF